MKPQHHVHARYHMPRTQASGAHVTVIPDFYNGAPAPKHKNIPGPQPQGLLHVLMCEVSQNKSNAFGGPRNAEILRIY